MVGNQGCFATWIQKKMSTTSQKFQQNYAAALSTIAEGFFYFQNNCVSARNQASNSNNKKLFKQ